MKLQLPVWYCPECPRNGKPAYQIVPPGLYRVAATGDIIDLWCARARAERGAAATLTPLTEAAAGFVDGCQPYPGDEAAIRFLASNGAKVVK